MSLCSVWCSFKAPLRFQERVVVSWMCILPSQFNSQANVPLFCGICLTLSRTSTSCSLFHPFSRSLLRPVHTGTNIGARYSPAFFNAFVVFTLKRFSLTMSRVNMQIDPFNVCKHRKPRLGARAAWGQKNGAANRPAYCVKEKQTSLIDR